MAAIPDGKNNMIPEGNSLFAVPKKGRLYEKCMKLLAGAGLDHRRVSQRISTMVDLIEWLSHFNQSLLDPAMVTLVT